MIHQARMNNMGQASRKTGKITVVISFRSYIQIQHMILIIRALRKLLDDRPQPEDSNNTQENVLEEFGWPHLYMGGMQV